MEKMPPIEKIPEAYTAIEDNRVTIYENYATVNSSDNQKKYLIKWKDNLYFSDDNSTYWQGYLGYPVLAVLMLQGKLSLNKEISKYFKNINWNKLNKENKRDYKKSVAAILENVSEEEKKLIYLEMDKVFAEIKELNIELTKKASLQN